MSLQKRYRGPLETSSVCKKGLGAVHALKVQIKGAGTYPGFFSMKHASES